MTAVWLRLTVVLVCLAAFAAARTLGAGNIPAAAAALAILFALYVLLVLASIAIAWSGPRETLPRRKTGFLALCGAAAAECLASFVLFAIVQPFGTLFMRAQQKPLTGQTLPVMFVHGYLCNRGLWWWLGKRLRERGIAAGAIDLEPPLASIDALADMLHARIEAYLCETGNEELVLVTHSMGGLAARAYLKRHGPARVAKLITLACPHRGTRLARLGLGLNARQMRPGSRWLCELNRAGPLPVPAVTVWSVHDNIVAPQASSRLEGAGEIVLTGPGHLSLVFSRQVADIVLRELNSCQPPKVLTATKQ